MTRNTDVDVTSKIEQWQGEGHGANNEAALEALDKISIACIGYD